MEDTEPVRDRMFAMVLEQPRNPLQGQWLPMPEPSEDQVLIQVGACGVCRTDLHIVDAELPSHKLPLIPGHEIAGTVIHCGGAVACLRIGQRVGVPWLGYSCGYCGYCRTHRENLCDHDRFTGYDMDEGYP